jgi:hypothetical protein
MAFKHASETVTDNGVIMEHCRNPWNKNCKSDDIVVYILVNGEKLPICRRCWSKIADKDWEV